MKLIRSIVFLLFGLLLSVPIAAQIVYQCDFEDGDERTKWSMNIGKNQALINQLENKWYIGYAGNHGEEGRYGLFISNDGTHATFTNNKTAIVYAYRDIELQPGDYYISFDWRSNSSASSGEGMYVCIVPLSDPSVSINSAAQTVPDWVERYALNQSVMGGQATWQMQHAKVTVMENVGTLYRLVVAWFQNGTKIATPPSGMVDNIVIMGEQKCEAPSGLSYTIDAQALHLKWQGTADYYDVKVYDYNEDRWQVFSPVVGRKVDIGNLSEGVHDIFIRAHCGDLVSEYILFKPFYYKKGDRCIEYMALDDQNLCRCYTGSYTNQRESQRRVSFTELLNSSEYKGESAPLFSLHIMPDEFDPYTDYELRTKPKNAVASVRLGRFEPTFGACTEYNYTVPDGDHSILMLRYAVVLPNPHPDNDPPANPKFKLEVLANNKAIHDSCGIADFMSSYGEAASWNESQNAGQAVLWKDWTEVAINLREYVGQRITVRLMTTGCSMSAHGGYAYYTLACEDGALTGINCGDIPTTQFVAPSGFDYAWYLPDNPDIILGTDRVFDVDPMDTLTYNVDVISKTNNRCYYTLDATAIPRFPVAEATAEKTDDHCENTVVFHQTCHVKYKNQITDQEWHTEKPVETIVWDFGDGSKQLATLNEYVTHTYPRDGGSFTATLTAGIVDDLCQVQQAIPLSLPKIGIDPIVVHADVCEGDCYLYNGAYYCNTYQDTIYYQSMGGCDSTVIFDIIMHERNYEATAGLCEGEGFRFGDKILYEPGIYTHTFQSSVGCDSVVRLTLDVEPILTIMMPDTAYICMGEPALNVDYAWVQGNLDSIILRTGQAAQAMGLDSVYVFQPGEQIVLPLPEEMTPARIEADIEYATPFCPVPPKHVTLEVRYNTSVFLQNDGVLVVTNSQYNGGYTFLTYQWYRDGVLIPGATQPYYAPSSGDLGHVFTVVMTQEGMDAELSSCEIVYSGAQGWEQLHYDAPLRIYTMLGVYIGQAAGWEKVSQLPRGIYIISDGQFVYKITK